MKRFFLKTMGCQMNDHDSEVIKGILLSLGYQSTARADHADLILYNTCCVRANPERKVYGHLTAYKRLKEQNPQLIMGLCGCMPQQKQELAKILKQLPHLDLIFGTHNIHRLPELLARAERGEQVVEIWEQSAYEEGSDQRELLPIKRSDKLRAYVNVIYGCTNFCTYCIVPYVRGKEHSRLPGKIVKEVAALVAEGYQEVTLLGQNVNAYGKDLSLDTSFSSLLGELNDLEGLERIRFTTSHPRDMGEDLIAALADLDKVCEHLHLPVQAGSSRLLRRMGRGYTREYYLELVEKIRRSVPQISLTTDFIVGFPGETDQDFEETLSLVREVEFDSAFTFIYSPREGTPAAQFSEQIPEELQKERIYRLIELQNSISARKMQKLVGQEVQVLLESRGKTGLVGRTRTNRLVHLHEDADLIGSLRRVKITEAGNWSLKGEIL